MKNFKTILATVFIFITISCKSQNIDDIITNQILGNEELRLDKKQTSFLKNNFNIFYNQLTNISQYNENQISNIINILHFITVNDTVNKINKIKTVEFFTSLLTSTSLNTRSLVLNPLTRYDLNDFNIKAKRNIEKLFTKENRIYLRPEIYKLAGFLQLKNVTPYLINNMNNSNKWDTMISLARLGNTDALNFCLSELMKKKDFDYSSKKDFYLYYIRQPESLKLLIDRLNNKTSIQDISKPSIMTPVNYQAYIYLKKFIKGFPSKLFEKDETSYDEKIKKIQNWLEQNKNNLEINKNIY